MTTSSQMEKEASEAPAVVANQLKKNEAILKTFVNRLQKSKLKFAMTIARGSSGHAALFAKYLLETRFQLIAAQAAPAVFTLYKTELPLQDSLVIAISQSGSSPDVAEMLHAARRTGAITAAFVNNVDSPLAKAAEYVIPLHAGEERSVAASYHIGIFNRF